MNMLKRCVEFLKQSGVRYSHSIHARAATARETAEADCTPAHNLAKTVVYFGDKGYGMLVLPADSYADLREVARLLEFDEIRLATEVELAEMFPDCEVGTMPPLGNLFDLPVLMEERMVADEYMAFAAGTRRDTIHMGVGDYIEIVNPLLASFALADAALLFE